MKYFRYIDRTATLQLDQQACIGCGRCVVVCPHQLLALDQGKGQVIDADRCMECGACQTNCPTGAVRVEPGVGCAAHIIAQWVNRLCGRKVMQGCC